MISFSVTNTKSFQALRGQAVKITLGSSELSELSNIQEGQIVQNASTDVLGYVVSVDYYGNSFEVMPAQPDFSFSSASTPGYLDAGEIVYVNGLENLLLQEDDYALLQEDGGAILLEN